MAISDLSLLPLVQNISYEHDNDVKVQMKQSVTKKWLHMKTDYNTEASSERFKETDPSSNNRISSIVLYYSSSKKGNANISA